MAQTFSAKEVAQECGTDARTLRKFLRDWLPQDEQPGQGGRYSFTKGEVTKIKKAFVDHEKKAGVKAAATETPVKGKSKKGKSKETAPEIEELSEDELIDLADLDPDETDIEDGDELGDDTDDEDPEDTDED